ncbi:MAG: hypothetical protein U1E76_21885 [Planctomycetota bacterium]
MRGIDLDLRAAGFANRLHLRTEGDLPEVYPHLGGGALMVFAHHAGPTTWLFRMQGKALTRSTCRSRRVRRRRRNSAWAGGVVPRRRRARRW